jgi:DNA-binding response OmpR family regulator
MVTASTEVKTASVLVPRRDNEDPWDSTRPKAQVSRGRETILLVDDEDSLRLVIAKILEKAGYVVIRASDGLEALRLAVSHPGRIQLIVTDLMMPGMKGPDMVREVRQRRPGVRVLYLSGHTEDSVMSEGLLAEGENFLQKPFALATFTQRVREILDSPGSAR